MGLLFFNAVLVFLMELLTIGVELFASNSKFDITPWWPWWQDLMVNPQNKSPAPNASQLLAQALVLLKGLPWSLLYPKGIEPPSRTSVF